VPQALAGVAAVGLLSATVRRRFGVAAGLLAGAVLALTPVAALMFRFDNPDALLVLLLVVAGWALTRALEEAGTRWLVLAGAALGLAFLTKLFQAFLVLPAFALVYLVAAPAPFVRRLGQTAVAGLAIVVAGGWWVAVVELWPAGSRPYIGGSTSNSVVDLMFGYDGLGRLNGTGGANFSGQPGLLRLFDVELGGQIGWLVPAALLALVAGLWTTRRARAPRTDPTRAALVLWGGWLVVGGLVYDEMAGGIHPYYTNTLAPAIGALVGIGATLLWRERATLAARVVLAAGVAATALWSFWLLERTPTWHHWLHVLVLVLGFATAAAILFLGDLSLRAVAAVLATAALVAVLAGPTAYTLGTVARAQSGGIAAGPAGGFGGGPLGEGTAAAALATLLRANAGAYTWVAATSSSHGAAPVEIATGLPVMAVGGFNGGDPEITLARFRQLVAAGKIHYWIAAGLGGPGGRGGGEIESWVTSTFTAQTVGGTTVYDLTAS
jgi:4-amino-4-deoxy-L-arabinose transferase-like glycosyltransferase